MFILICTLLQTLTSDHTPMLTVSHVSALCIPILYVVRLHLGVPMMSGHHRTERLGSGGQRIATNGQQTVLAHSLQPARVKYVALRAPESDIKVRNKSLKMASIVQIGVAEFEQTSRRLFCRCVFNPAVLKRPLIWLPQVSRSSL